MINLKPVYDGNFVIDVSEWNNLRDIYRNFMCKKDDATIQLQLYDAFIAFLDWFIQYCNANIGNKSYSYDDVSPQIFIVEVKKKGQWESYLRYSLYTSRLYAEHVKKILKKEHIERYDNLISVLEADLEWLIINFERHCCKENRNILMCSHSRKNAYSFDVLMLTERIFNIEEVPELIDVDFFSLKPNILFLIRQLLEIVGKDLIGFMSICDENGNPSHQFTQVAWTFLSEKEKDKSKRWNISLPVKCSTIQKINAWTNSFVHAGRFNMIWQQYYALEIVGALMKPSTNYIRECNGNCRQSMMFGDFKIEGYYWMKKDFEEYVYKGAQRIKSPRVIWNDIEKIGAYMLSYGSPSILFLVDTFNTSRGLSKTGEYLINSVYLNRFVNKNIIDHNFGSEDNFVSKLRKGFLYLTKVVKSIKVNNAVAAYINPRTSGFGLLADFLVIQILKRRFNKSSINKNLSCNHPIVLHLHGVGISNKQPGWFNNWVYKKMFRDVYVMLVDESQYVSIKPYVKNSNLLICPNGVKEYNRGMMPIRNNPSPQIIFISDMIKSKGCLDLLEACKKLMDKGVDFGCTFIGEETEGITKKSFEKEISNRNLKNYVQYLGNIPEDDIHGYLGIADIFAYPTYNGQESVPIVLLEAMEQALPCVATKEEGITSIIEDGVTGFLVDKQCPNKLAECLEKLIQDPELRKDMGREAKCRFEEKYTLTIFERNFMNCINQCI